MSQVNVRIEGISALANDLRKAGDINQFKPIVKTYTNQLATQTQLLMNQKYKGHWEWDKAIDARRWVYPTGTTRRSTVPMFEDNGLTGVVSPSTSYFPFLEYGTRYMHARPTLHPAFEVIAPQFKQAIEKQVKGK